MVYINIIQRSNQVCPMTNVNSSVEQKHIIKQTRNTLDSDNTIIMVRGLVTFLWQMVEMADFKLSYSKWLMHYGKHVVP